MTQPSAIYGLRLSGRTRLARTPLRVTYGKCRLERTLTVSWRRAPLCNAPRRTTLRRRNSATTILCRAPLRARTKRLALGDTRPRTCTTVLLPIGLPISCAIPRAAGARRPPRAKDTSPRRGARFPARRACWSTAGSHITAVTPLPAQFEHNEAVCAGDEVPLGRPPATPLLLAVVRGPISTHASRESCGRARSCEASRASRISLKGKRRLEAGLPPEGVPPRHLMQRLESALYPRRGIFTALRCSNPARRRRATQRDEPLLRDLSGSTSIRVALEPRPSPTNSPGSWVLR